jgi:DNA polymerase-3 subunit epsilon
MTRVPFAEPNLVLDGIHYGGPLGPYSIDSGFAVVDVETTGLSAASGARIVEVAIHLTSGDGSITDSLVSLVNPGTSDTGAEHIHGITPMMVKDAPSWQHLWPEIAAMLSGRIFVAHNATFDASFIARENSLLGVSSPLAPGLCTYWLARQALPEIERHNLDAVTRHLDLVNSRPHAAEGDTRVVVEALPALLERVSPIGHYVLASDAISRTGTVVTKGRE